MKGTVVRVVQRYHNNAAEFEAVLRGEVDKLEDAGVVIEDIKYASHHVGLLSATSYSSALIIGRKEI